MRATCPAPGVRPKPLRNSAPERAGALERPGAEAPRRGSLDNTAVAGIRVQTPAPVSLRRRAATPAPPTLKITLLSLVRPAGST